MFKGVTTRIKQLSIKLMKHVHQSPELKIKHFFKVMKRVEVSPNRGRGGWWGGMLWGLWWRGQLLRSFWRENLRSKKIKKGKNSNDVVMNKTDGLLIQSLRRLWVYHRGGELLPGCIHTEHQNLRNIRGMVGTQEASLPQSRKMFLWCVCVTGWWEMWLLYDQAERCK